MIVRRSHFFSILLLLITPSLTMGYLLPQSIGSMRLDKLLVGKEARKEIDRLHGKHLEFRKGYIGTYIGGDRKAKVWVSEYDSEEDAAEANLRMARKIKAMEGKGFHHFREFYINETPVNFVLEQGRAHYFFQNGKKVIWLEVDPSEARKTIRDLIKQIP